MRMPGGEKALHQDSSARVLGSPTHSTWIPLRDATGSCRHLAQAAWVKSSSAEDTSLERRVAVKLLPAAVESDRLARERFRREALSAAALDHPFICKIHEIGEADGRLFIVMEYVEGETLHAAAGRELLPMRQVIEIANELAEALDAAHRRSIIHRDLKPANVMVTPQGHVKVMDFGLAKQLDGQPRASGQTPTLLTGSGTRLGTPAYMSPEQVLGAPLDPRSDIFSLGIMLHELATGAHPFLCDSPGDTMTAILRDAPRVGARDAEGVPGFAAVVTRTLAKACAERYQTTTELLTDLSALRGRAWSTSAGAAVKTSAQPVERTPFVGRDAEAVELSRLLDRMLTGQGGLVLFGGEPGVGKTRLAREVMAAARQRGCFCLTGHCYEMEGAPPFMPFVEITEESVRLVPQAVRAAMGDLAAGDCRDGAEPASRVSRHSATAGRSARPAATADLRGIPRISAARLAEVTGGVPARRSSLG